MSNEEENTIPNVIYDANTGKSYMKGRFFGKVRATARALEPRLRLDLDVVLTLCSSHEFLSRLTFIYIR